MFQQLLQGLGTSLWEQCRLELQRVNGKDVPVEEVDRLSKLVSHQVYGDFTNEIQEAVASVVNGFVDDLPF